MFRWVDHMYLPGRILASKFSCISESSSMKFSSSPSCSTALSSSMTMVPASSYAFEEADSSLSLSVSPSTSIVRPACLASLCPRERRKEQGLSMTSLQTMLFQLTFHSSEVSLKSRFFAAVSHPALQYNYALLDVSELRRRRAEHVESVLTWRIQLDFL
jgi:hypothetical protein